MAGNNRQQSARRDFCESCYSDSSLDASDDDLEGWSHLAANSAGIGSPDLAFSFKDVQDVILTLADSFDMRVVMGKEHAKHVMMLSGGLAIAGSYLGGRYGGDMGALIGGAIGGACGLGIAITLRDLWDEVKTQLWDMVELAYDYLAGMGIKDYTTAARTLTQLSRKDGETLVLMLAEVASKLLNKQVTTSITQQ